MLLHVKCHLNDVRLVNSAQTAFQCVTDTKWWKYGHRHWGANLIFAYLPCSSTKWNAPKINAWCICGFKSQTTRVHISSAADERVFPPPETAIPSKWEWKSSLTDNDLCGGSVCFGVKFVHTDLCIWVEVVLANARNMAFGYLPVFLPGQKYKCWNYLQKFSIIAIWKGI